MPGPYTDIKKELSIDPAWPTVAKVFYYDHNLL